HPYVRIFLHRKAGNQVIWALLADGEGEFPTREPVRVSVSDLARRFHVSRVHIKRMLEEAEREGLVDWRQPTVRLEEPCREYIRWIYAGQLLQLLVAAARAMKQLSEQGHPFGSAPPVI